MVLMNKGFTVPIVSSVVVLLTLVLAGGGYGAYKYSQIKQENHKFAEELEKQKDEKIKQLETRLSEVQTTSVDVSASRTEDVLGEVTNIEIKKEEPQIKTVVQEKIVYVPQEVSGAKTSEENFNVVSENTGASENNTYLKISDVKVFIDGFMVDVYWNTNKASDSRLVINGDDIYASNEHDSTEHHVKISELKFSKNYSYQIIASVDGEEDSYYDNFETERRFDVVFIDSSTDEEKCFLVYVIDTEKLPLVNTTLEITGAWFGSTSRYVSDRLVDKTDSEGKVLYCGPIDEIKVKNMDNNEVYYNGDVTL